MSYSNYGGEDDGSLYERLLRLKMHRSNRYCADCDESDPSWYSNEGVLICKLCAEAHERALSASIQSLRSQKIDERVIKGLEQKGNSTINGHLEKFIIESGCRKMNSNSSLAEREQFCIDKYSKKKFATPREDDAKNKGPKYHQLVTEAMPIRLCDYFLCMEREDVDPFINTTAIDPLTHSFKAKIADRYPKDDHEDAPLTDNVPMFAFPSDINIYEGKHPPEPVLFPFVLTKLNGAKQYGCSLVFYERMDLISVMRMVENAKVSKDDEEEKLMNMSQNTRPRSYATTPTKKDDDMSSSNSGYSKEQDVYMKELYSPKAICTLSHWPFFSLFEGFLKTLYRISLSSPPIPLERFIINFFHEVPVPPLGRTRVVYTLANEVFIIQRPPPNEIPLHDLPLQPIFEYLDPLNIISIVSAIATEQRVVFCSDSIRTLVTVIEGFCCFLFPFSWQGVYMPILPRRLAEYLYAPVPFLAGILRRDRDYIDQPHDVVFVDIEANDVFVSSIDQVPAFPDKDKNKLLKRIKEYGNILIKKSERNVNTNVIDEAFPNYEHNEPVTQFAAQAGFVVNNITSSGHGSYNNSNNIYSQGNGDKKKKNGNGDVNSYWNRISNSNSSSNRDYLVVGDPRPLHRSSANITENDRKSTNNLSSPDNLRSRSQSVDNNSRHMNEIQQKREREQKYIGSSLGNNEQTYKFDSLELRKAFLRLWVKLFMRYRHFMKPDNSNTDEKNKNIDKNDEENSLFDHEGFLSDAPLESRTLLDAMINTQLFNAFISERWSPTCKSSSKDSPEVRYFDEQIVAKELRSTKGAFKSKLFSEGPSTPFLDDKSYQYVGQFLAPPPDTSGLKGLRIHYKYFPRLKEELFGPIRFVKPLIQESSLQRLQKRFLMRQFSFNEKKKNNSTELSDDEGEDDVNRMGKYSYKSESRGSRGKMEWRYLIPKLQACWRGYAERKRIGLSMRSAGRTVKEHLEAKKKALDQHKYFLKLRVSVCTIQAALRTYMKAHRFRALHSASLTVQAHWRTYSAVRAFKLLKKCVLCIEKQWGVRDGGARDAWIVRKKFLKQKHSVQVIEAYLLTRLALQWKENRLKAIRTVQSSLRTVLEVREKEKRLRAIRWIGQCARTQQIRNHFKRMKYSSIKIQAAIRGFLERGNTRRKLAELFKVQLKTLVGLWERHHIPLAFRARFWCLFCEKATFFSLQIVTSEVESLKNLELGSLFYNVLQNNDVDKKRTIEEKKVEKELVSKEKNRNSMEMNCASEIRIGKYIVEEELKLLYKYMKQQLQDSEKETIYNLFDIPVKGKKRKKAFMEKLWNYREEKREFSSDVQNAISSFKSEMKREVSEINNNVPSVRRRYSVFTKLEEIGLFGFETFSATFVSLAITKIHQKGIDKIYPYSSISFEQMKQCCLVVEMKKLLRYQYNLNNVLNESLKKISK